jgi:hypothetical protein
MKKKERIGNVFVWSINKKRIKKMPVVEKINLVVVKNSNEKSYLPTLRYSSVAESMAFLHYLL